MRLNNYFSLSIVYTYGQWVAQVSVVAHSI
jgi:hypothetical protein